VTLLLASLIVLTNTVVKVPPSHWTAIELKVPQNRTTVIVSFKVENGPRVQAIVMSREEADRFNRGKSIRPLLISGFEKSDKLRVVVPDAGDYVLVLDNRIEARFPAEVTLRVELNLPNDAQVSYVPQERRRATVALSLLFFGAVVVFSAAKFLRT
jgi:hypothetical protein